ncbi:phosphatidic acid phosphatase type 2/haloperoxidase [Peziza echinospora]|nr:phosphatidic acid phosphatase type 2/haloperoxidase [Peziza echinospora]
MAEGDTYYTEPPLASLSLTHVYYNPHDPLSLVSAWLALVPQALVISYTVLSWGQREIELILMFVGQLGCEAVNWALKRLIKENRPTQMHGKGYGMPSSHSQFVAFFSVYITLWVFFRNRHLSPTKSLAISSISLLSAAAICASRIYLSYHTPKQVLAGIVAGVVIAVAWFCVTSFLRHHPDKYWGRSMWEWIMYFGSFVWVKDMCLEVDLVEHDWHAWRRLVDANSRAYREKQK